MKKIILTILTAFMILALAGCGGDDAPRTVVTQILSDSAFDGDIREFSSGVFTIRQGNTQSVLAGIDPATLAEYRAFLDFPLTGGNGVPGTAVIVSATLDIFIDDIFPQPLAGEIPIRIDLVSFQPPILVETDFSHTLQPALATTTIMPPISEFDFGRHVFVDVTSLMAEAQRLGLADFQLRILQDPGVAAPGLIEINDTTGGDRPFLAPLLQVEYF